MTARGSRVSLKMWHKERCLCCNFLTLSQLVECVAALLALHEPEPQFGLEGGAGIFDHVRANGGNLKQPL